MKSEMVHVDWPIGDIEAAFDLMEGNGHFARSNKYGNSRYCFDYVAANRLRILEESKDFDHSNDMPADSMGCIYGSGGWHRYYLLRDGTIAFSAHHAHYPKEKKIKMAANVGFLIFG